jgi:hypothetical protein
MAQDPTNPGSGGQPAETQPADKPAVVPAKGSADARDASTYIGATAFAAMQKQYTPYQIEQATSRDVNGNIYQKSGVDIGSVPTGPPSSKLQAPGTPPTPSTNNISNGTTASDATLTKDQGSTPPPTSTLASAQSYLDGIQAAKDALLEQRQNADKAAKEKEQENIKSDMSTINALSGTTRAQDQYQAQLDKYQVQQKMADLTTVQQKLADATSAMTAAVQGALNADGSVSFNNGTAQAIMDKSKALIAGLQVQAEAIKGNIDLAKSFADAYMVQANKDNTDAIDAAKQVLKMHEDGLVTLTADEKATIDQRMKLLDDRATQLQANKDKVFTLMTTYPSAAAKGGVTLTDTPEAALAKMQPQMNAQEQKKLAAQQAKDAADLAKTKADTDLAKAQANKANREPTGGSGSSVPKELAPLESALSQMFTDKVDDSTAIALIQQKLGHTLSFDSIKYIKDMFSTNGAATPDDKPMSISDEKTWATENGVKPGTYVGKTPNEAAKAEEDAKSAADSENGGHGRGAWGAFRNFIGI